MCGIFAWAGKSPKQFNKQKLDILGIFNEARGTHSCGIAKDGDIVIGIDKNKVYKNFLANINYTVPKKTPVVIGHTRHSTYGAHTIENAHPFGFGELNGGYEFIGVHNGTLLNHKDLAEKFNIKHTEEIKRSKHSTSYRGKIDSEIILEIIYTHKNFKVLNEYNGAAALVFTNLNEPNVIYCYHGESRKRDIENDVTEEERPLYYYKQGKNSLFISSMLASLTSIGAGSKDNDWGEFDTNTVYKITDGDIENAKKFKVVRTDRFQTGTARASRNYNQRDYTNNNNRLVNNRREQAGHQYNMEEELKREREVNNAHNRAAKMEAGLLSKFNLYHEIPPQNINYYGSSIYFQKLRYWRNGHRINGCFTWIPGHGFYFLGESVKAAEERFYAIVNSTFVPAEKDFILNPKKIKNKHKENSFIPFVHGIDGKEIVNPSPYMYYFFDGIRVKTRNDYFACLEFNNTQLEPLHFTQLTYMSAHPILDIDVKYKGFKNQEIMIEGHLADEVICPLGSERIYYIEKGNCIDHDEIQFNETEEGESCELVDERAKMSDQEVLSNLVIAANNIKKIESGISEKEEEGQENDMLEDDINDMFKESLRKFPMFCKRLQGYKDNTRAKAAFNILNQFVHQATDLVAIEEKE